MKQICFAFFRPSAHFLPAFLLFFAAPVFGQLTITITPDNPNPTIGCEADNVVKYTVEVCNTSMTTGFKYNLTINSPLNRQFVTEYDPALQLTQVNSTLEQLTGTLYIYPGNCDTYTFSAEVFNFGVGGSFIVSASTYVFPSGATAYAETTISNLSEIVISGAQAISSLIPGTLPANGCDGVARKIRLTADAVLQIDQDYCFSNTEFIMEGGASIVVQNGASGPSNLVFYPCKLFGCGTMWRGITVQESNAVELRGVSISDAQYGVQSQNAASVFCLGNTFDRNYVGVFLPGVNGAMQSTQITMAGNTFSCTDDLASAFANQSPAPGLKGYAGIEAYNLLSPVFVNSWGFQEGYFQARFSDMRNGIIMDNCNSLNVLFCIFEDLKEVAGNDGYPMSGRGIDFRAGESLSVTGWGGDPGAGTPTFNNCDYAIEAESAGIVTVTDNNMLSTQFAVSLYQCTGALDISENYMEAAWKGVLSYECQPLTGKIADNYFLIGFTPAIGFGAPTVAAAMGIYDYNVLVPEIYWDIHDNEISLVDANTGIDVAFTRNARVYDNTIYMINSDWNKTGILLGADANENQVYQNDIYGTFSADACEPSVGIRVVNSYADTISCNIIYDTNYGIQFLYSCGSTDLKGNQMLGTNDIGLILGDEPLHPGCSTFPVTNTAIGLQRYRGNIWDGNYNMHGARNTATSSLVVSKSLFIVHQPTPQSPRYMPPSVSAIAPWFFNFPPPTGEDNYHCSGESPEKFTEVTPTSLDSAIAAGIPGDGEFVNTFRWSLKRQLLQRLDEHPDWLTGNAMIRGFYNDPQNAAARAFHDFSSQVSALGRLNASEISYVTQLNTETRALLGDYNDAVKYRYSCAPDEQDMPAAANKANRLFRQLRTKLGQLHSFRENHRNKRAAAATALLSQIGSLPANAIYESNEKSVLEVTLQLAASGVAQLSATQRNVLIPIAEQCFYSGGNAVAAARHMLNFYDGPKAYNDDRLCNEVVSRTAQRSAVADFALWPNPAQDVVYISSGSAMQKIALTDLGGRILREQSVDNGSETTFALPDLASGVYLLSVTRSDGFFAVRKIAVVK